MAIDPKSQSQWLYPVRLIRKKSGKLCFTLDLRKLNEIVDLDGFEIPNMNEMIRSLGEEKHFSIIDLQDGYFQVDLLESDRNKTTFMGSDNGLLRFTKMPQGFKNSPDVFQRGMTMVLEGLIGKVCLVYLDYILIFGKTKSEHDLNLKLVLNRLEKYNLKINKDKSMFCVSKVVF